MRIKALAVGSSSGQPPTVLGAFFQTSRDSRAASAPFRCRRSASYRLEGGGVPLGYPWLYAHKGRREEHIRDLGAAAFRAQNAPDRHLPSLLAQALGLGLAVARSRTHYPGRQLSLCSSKNGSVLPTAIGPFPRV